MSGNGNGTVAVFVYGTLKRGRSNHGVVEDLVLDAREATVDGFRLLDCGSFPGARPEDGATVRGDLLTLAFPTAALVRLDRLEGTPHLYTRERVTATTAMGEQVECWIYVLNVSRCARGGGWGWREMGKDEEGHYVWPESRSQRGGLPLTYGLTGDDDEEGELPW